VTAGQSDAAILDAQAAQYGPKVRAEGAGIWLFLLPLAAGVALAALGLSRLRRPAAAPMPATAGSGSVGAAELSTVERELKELE
jgi:cytochrome c-type biogenesis protein CcmH/NrfF